MNELISIVNQYLIPPYQSELLDSVEAALERRNVDSYNSARILGNGSLASALMKRKQKTHGKFSQE